MGWKNVIFKEWVNNSELCELFEQQLVLAAEAAAKLHHLFASMEENRLEQVACGKSEIHAFENAGDATLRRINEFLDSKSFMRLEHDDSHQLGGCLDDVLDAVDACVLRLKCYGLTDVREEAQQLVVVTVRMIADLSELLVCVGTLDRNAAQKHIIAIHDAEHDADVLLENGLTRLHSDCTDAKYILEWERILDLLEEVTDTIQHTADIMEMIIRKYA